MTAIALVQRASGLLRTFNAAGVLAAGDVHVALRLGRLAHEDREPVLLAAALAVRALRAGSVCLELNRMHDIGVDSEGFNTDAETGAALVDPANLPWPAVETVIAALRESPLVCGAATGPLRPLRLVDHRSGPLLYLDRYYRQEQTVRRILTERAASSPPVDPAVVRRHLDQLFPDEGGAPDRQRIAAALAATGWTTVVAGGPGTGKTHVVAGILALLMAVQRAGPDAPRLRIALAAPTGRAAARLQEAVREQADRLGLPDLTAATLHRLLGWQRGAVTRFRHHEFNRLPHDVVVVDETSMVSLTMMSRLLSALRSDARLVLVGDPDQLASVDAGAVLADLVAAPVASTSGETLQQVLGDGLDRGPDELRPHERERLRGGVVRLTRGRRFGGRIAELAVAVRAGDADAAVQLLSEGGEVSLGQLDDQNRELASMRADVQQAAAQCVAAAERGDAAEALLAMESHRLLCAHRRGGFGVEQWDRRAARWALSATENDSATAEFAGGWFLGQPLLVTANDHEARIYNGDTGVVVRGPDGGPRVALRRGSAPWLVHPSRLPSVTTVYAMTIHRSQGSQYDAVSVVLPGPESTLLTRELLYTAITRARHRVRILGTEAALRAGIARRVLRASGLRAT